VKDRDLVILHRFQAPGLGCGLSCWLSVAEANLLPLVHHAMQKPSAQEHGRPVAKCPPKDPRRGRALRPSKRGWWRRPLRGAFIPCTSQGFRSCLAEAAADPNPEEWARQPLTGARGQVGEESKALIFPASLLPPRGRSCTFPLLSTVSSEG